MKISDFVRIRCNVIGLWAEIEEQVLASTPSFKESFIYSDGFRDRLAMLQVRTFLGQDRLCLVVPGPDKNIWTPIIDTGLFDQLQAAQVIPSVPKLAHAIEFFTKVGARPGQNGKK